MIKILNAGIFTTIQDFGRLSHQSEGISVSGAMDKYALRMGNLLNGNEENMAAFEITYSSFKCEFLSDTSIALTGANLDYYINNKKVCMYETLYINNGDLLECKSIISGVRGYLTILGGFDVKDVLASKSTYIKGKFGGFEGRKLNQGDIIKSNKLNQKRLKNKRIIGPKIIKKLYESRSIKVILGPEENRFTKEGLDVFLSNDYELCPDSDRMGYRFLGEKIEHVNGADILSAPLTFGSIQVPGSGQPIIMMADRQTTGGYTKIAHVISLDHSYLAQLKAGEIVSFNEVSIENAQDMFREFEVEFANLKNSFSTRVDEDYQVRRFKVKINKNEYNISVAINNDNEI